MSAMNFFSGLLGYDVDESTWDDEDDEDGNEDMDDDDFDDYDDEDED